MRNIKISSIFILDRKRRIMENVELLGYLATALGGGGITQFLNWRINRKKGKEEGKGMEIENIKKIVDEVYKPLLEQQNTQIVQANARIKELEAEVKSLREERSKERDSYQKQIAALQKQIVDITKALGIKANGQIRDEKAGRTTK